MNPPWFDAALAACRLLADAADGRSVSVDDLPDEATLLGFSKVHRLETLVSSALRAVNTDHTLYRTLHEVADTAAFHQIKQNLIADDLLSHLETRGVNAVPLKGNVIQAVYPDGWIRTTTDTDLYIHPDQLSAACEALTEAGFTQKSVHDGDIVFQKPPHTVIELHTTLGGYSKKQQQALDRLSRTPFGIHEQYVYTLFHLYKHFLYAGAGVRLFWDMVCLSRAVTDRDYVEQWLRDLDLLPFDRAVQAVNGILFGGKPCTDDMTDVLGLIFRSGTFGTEETYHAMAKTAHPITRKNRFRVWLTDRGFDKNAMSARYPILKQYSVLFPVCLIHRVAYGMIFRRTVWRNAVKAEHAADRKQTERILRTMHIL